MRNSLAILVVFFCVSCAPHLISPIDQNSALVIGRVIVDNKYSGNFYGLLPRGVIEKGLKIEIESPDGKDYFSATTVEDGYFLVPNIGQNNYFVRRVTFEGASNNTREQRSQEMRRLNFTPLPGRVLYVGSLFIDLSERGVATYREAREDERTKAYFIQSFGSSPWASRAFVASGSSMASQVTKQTIAPATSEGRTQAHDKPEWKTGNYWRYAWKQPGTGGTLTREVVREEPFDGVPAYVVRVGKNEHFYAKEVLGLLATMSGGRVIQKRDAPFRVLAWPLEVGKEWKNSYTLERLEEKSSQRIDHRVAVSKVEPAQVPAGIFEAFKIEVFNAYSGNLLNEYWYSPQVKWFVKSRTYNQSGVREEELISYKID